MTTEPHAKTLVGLLKAVSEEQKGGKAAVVYQVMRDGMKYPDFITLWPDRGITRPGVRIGERYTWSCEAKPKGEGKKGEYLDFLSAAPASAAPAPAPQPAAPGAPPAPQRPTYDARNTSIERQTAVKAAVELAVAGKIGTEHIAEWIEFFASAIAAPPVAPQEQAPAAQGAAPEPVAEPLTPGGEQEALRANDYTAFYPLAKKAGYPDGKAVSAKLGMMPDAWLRANPGKTLADAVKVLEAKL